MKKCIFPVAGYGTRFLPFTKAIPKEMLPILNKPIIHYAVNEAIKAKMSEIVFVTNRGKEAIVDYFDRNIELENIVTNAEGEKRLVEVNSIISECDFFYTRQKLIKGLGHAVIAGEKIIGDETFAVILVDDLCVENDGSSVIHNMKEIYDKTGCSVIGVMKVTPEQVSRYGIIDFTQTLDVYKYNVLKVADLVEKPKKENAPSNYAVIGRYVLQPKIFDLLRKTKPGKNDEIQLTDALRILARKGELLAYEFKGRRFDCGMVEGFVKATNYFYEKRDGR